MDYLYKFGHGFAMIPQAGIRTVALSGAVALFCAILPAASAATELLMFERAGCPWCQRWNRDVGPVYPNTEEGRRAPLRRIDLDRRTDLKWVLREPIRFTPTFVLVENGREIGRLTGYINDETFWGMLANLLTKLDRDKP
jgi:hypothetical protein